MRVCGVSEYSRKGFPLEMRHGNERKRTREFNTSLAASAAYLKLIVDGVRYVLLPKSRDFLAQMNPVCYEGAVAG